jgi:translation initiation factor IF-3
MSHPERGRSLLERLAEDVSELGVIESAPIQDGRNMVMLLAPVREIADAKPEPAAKQSEAKPAATPEATKPEPQPEATSAAETPAETAVEEQAPKAATTAAPKPKAAAKPATPKKKPAAKAKPAATAEPENTPAAAAPEPTSS